MNDEQLYILAAAKKKVVEIFHSKLNPMFVFHTMEHTLQVVNAAEEMAGYYLLNHDDEFVLLASALFHDTGFTEGQSENHEEESVNLVQEFLSQYAFADELVARICSCIRATTMPQDPLSFIEKIICDADLFHLGTGFFSERSELLKKELENYSRKNISEKEWIKTSLNFLNGHTYFTGYCREKLEPIKQQWIKELKEKMIITI